MRDGVAWTNLTRSEIAMALGQEGFQVSTTVVDQLLDECGFRYRQAQRVKTMGESVDRDAQFEKIGQLKGRYLKAGLPILSLDAKKREILGDYVRPGRVLSRAPLRGWDHDFPQHRLGVVIPHGIYDVGRNEGYVHLNTSHDTSDFVIDSMLDWWRHHGSYQYRGAKQLLALFDSGGASGCRSVRFKDGLQQFADLTDLGGLILFGVRQAQRAAVDKFHVTFAPQRQGLGNLALATDGQTPPADLSQFLPDIWKAEDAAESLA